jgi:hypothetical protein
MAAACRIHETMWSSTGLSPAAAFAGLALRVIAAGSVVGTFSIPGPLLVFESSSIVGRCSGLAVIGDD